MTISYDPYSPEAMIDARPIYAQMLAEGPVHYLPDYKAWAIVGYDAVLQVCKDTSNFSVSHNSAPATLLGEPMAMRSFATLDLPDHRIRRRPLNPNYSKQTVQGDLLWIRQLAEEVLDAIQQRGTSFDAVRDYAEIVGSRVAGRKIGIPDEDSVWVRRRCIELFTREHGQRGSSTENIAAAQEAGAYLGGLVARCRQDPSLASGDLAALLETIGADGQPLDDAAIAGDLMTLLITGSETTEIAVGATLYYLALHPAQFDEVLADLSLVPLAFVEAIRYDHPTDMLFRRIVNDVDVCGSTLHAGENALLIWTSANRDPSKFADPEKFDIHRDQTKTLIFGHGLHKCLGEHLAVAMGSIMIQALLERVAELQVHTDQVQRKYAEFVKGIDHVPVTVVWR